MCETGTKCNYSEQDDYNGGEPFDCLKLDTMTKDIIEKSVMVRNVRDESSEEMLRITMANKVYDIGLCYDLGDYQNQMYAIIGGGNENFVSTMESIRKIFEADIETMINAYSREQ